MTFSTLQAMLFNAPSMLGSPSTNVSHGGLEHQENVLMQMQMKLLFFFFRKHGHSPQMAAFGSLNCSLCFISELTCLFMHRCRHKITDGRQMFSSYTHTPSTSHLHEHTLLSVLRFWLYVQVKAVRDEAHHQSLNQSICQSVNRSINHDQMDS